LKIDRPLKDGPDFDHLRRVIARETTEGPVPILELVVDAEIMAEATGIEFPCDRFRELLSPKERSEPEAVALGVQYLDLGLSFAETIGYDYVTGFPIIPVPRTPMIEKNNPSQDGKVRVWQEEHTGVIGNRQDYESFPWPSTDSINLVAFDYLDSRIPSGMKIVAFYPGIFEDLKNLMSFEQMAIKSIEEPELLGDILERLTVLAEDAVDGIAANPATGAVFYAEDMGYNSGTLLSPPFMRQWVIPRLKRIADVCHKHGKLFLLHSCGDIDALMEDLIDVVGIDARHSFQDNIEPIEQVYAKYGDRISVLGGVDVDLLSRGTPAEVRARTRRILETCAPGGGLCIGSGNSVTNFCKIENFYAMVDETRNWNEQNT